MTKPTPPHSSQTVETKNRLALEIAARGYAIAPDVLTDMTIHALIQEIATAGSAAGQRKGSDVYAIRNLLDEAPGVRALARSPKALGLAAAILGPDYFPVRGILFDKTADANWRVIWHQDLSIAVRERREAPGFGPWSLKSGVVHVQPPTEVLEKMITLRLHLDECALENGPLRVLPGSHLAGRLSAGAIPEWRSRIPEIVCPVPRGGALLMRPLLLHASSDAAVPGHRRVIHIEYAAAPLPGGLEWFETA
ncbi:phytanoyl-CoA dioxygenase [Capsulimonas corticalis]|uniref:Phytanoyl-CoA dioxygenase n=1 Tax=Capsulimonas corticalis TaxID=2219043 RepID=A0A402D1U9_9BACT|nr:phytanoyl-CoA dioxygenase family protein [Capsulimonas corticalis]BDI30068.1 phytanoyl-CoA dioxygenase [Capsulimonas corticalis]